HVCDSIGMQSRTCDNVLGGDVASSGLQHHFIGPIEKLLDAVTRQDVAAAGGNVIGVRSGDARKVDDARIGGPQRPDARAVRLDLLEQLGPDHLQALDAVGQTALVQVLQARQLGLVDGDDDLATAIGWDAFLLAVGIQLALALNAQLGLQAARGVVDPGVEDATVVASLVLTNARLLVQDAEAHLRVAGEKLASDGETY